MSESEEKATETDASATAVPALEAANADPAVVQPAGSEPPISDTDPNPAGVRPKGSNPRSSDAALDPAVVQPAGSDPRASEAAAAFEAVLAPLRDTTRAPAEAVPMVLTPTREPAPSSDGEPLLRVAGLRKSYGAQVALAGLSFELHPGEILGLLGANGAGKTTCLRILATILQADSGNAMIAGHDIAEIQPIRLKIGYLPDFFGSYDDLRVSDYLQFFARAYAVKPALRAAAIEQAMTTTGLAGLQDTLVESLSPAQAQRLALARLLMHDPSVLLLDEPVAGLDARARTEVLDILKGLSKQGKGIVLSANSFDELSPLAHRVAVLDRGRLVTLMATGELITRLSDLRRWRLRQREGSALEPLLDFLKEQPEVTSAVASGNELHVTFQGGDSAVERVHQRLFAHGLSLLEFAEEPLGPEELLQRLTGSSP